MKIIIPIAVVILAIMGCKTKQVTTTTVATTTTPPPHSQSVAHIGHLIIYRTRADYSQYVPVTLTDSGTAITSYPAPTDIYYHGVLAKPTALADGYWLDNRGVTTHSVFIKVRYEDYAQLTTEPSLDVLYQMVVDKKPFTDMYDMGPRAQYKDEVKEINAIILGGKLKAYKKLL